MIRPSRPLVAIAALAALGAAAVASASEGSELADAAPDVVELGDAPGLDGDSLHDLVADAQRLLRLRGYDPGPIDGRFGWRTQRAIRAYQATARSHGYLEALKGPGGAVPVPAPRPALVRIEGQPATALE